MRWTGDFHEGLNTSDVFRFSTSNRNGFNEKQSRNESSLRFTNGCEDETVELQMDRTISFCRYAGSGIVPSPIRTRRDAEQLAVNTNGTQTIHLIRPSL